mmetsp:Transcript_37878/g.121885  ORF Transcript_37878/g.121885 Transcript_37878/m.121885 type:complete len:346 (+) Transcript_37878:57-1094(+)
MSKKAPAGVSPCSTMDMLQFDMFPKPPAQPSPRAGDAPPLLASMASSERHALQVDEAGEVLVCGGSALQDEGETFVAHLGLGVEWGAPIAAPTPLAANPELGQAHAVAAGSLHSLILSQTGQVWSCGAGWEGPLGHGNEASLCVPTRIPALADVPISMIAAGRAHSLAISADGALYSWGWGKSGQLGHGDRASVHVPRRVEAIAPPLVALQVVAGDAHTVVLCGTGHVYTFGQALHGQCGHGACGCEGVAVPDQLTPRRVDALKHTRVVRVGAAADMTTAVTSSGGTFSWGHLPGCTGCVPLPTPAPAAGRAPLPRIASAGAVNDGCAVASHSPWERASCLRSAA